MFLYQNDYYLVDNCGDIVHQWDDQVASRYHPKLAKNGDLLFVNTHNLWRVDWEGNATIIYENTDDDFHFDYEVIEMNNGNFLCLGRREFTDALKDQYAFNSPSIEYDVIVEVDVISNQIVWEWKTIEHMVQDHDNTATNFGVIEDHPELLAFSKLSPIDWQTETFMINGFDFNEDLDQIVVSLRRMGEIAVIDHSTTAEEATGHTGGLSGHGGDILYRWGNPNNYTAGDLHQQKLFYQHNPNWVQYGEHEDKLIVFNNGLYRDNRSDFLQYSSVEIIDPPIDSSGNYYLDSFGLFEPATPDWIYVDTFEFPRMFSGYTSSAKVLPNSNILISVGGYKWVLEVTPDGELVWQYNIPLDGLLFRSEAYGLDFAGFVGRELSPDGTVEFPSSTYACNLYSAIKEAHSMNQSNSEIKTGQDFIEFSTQSYSPMYIQILQYDGKLVSAFEETNAFFRMETSQFNPGSYIAVLRTERQLISKSFVVSR